MTKKTLEELKAEMVAAYDAAFYEAEDAYHDALKAQENSND